MGDIPGIGATVDCGDGDGLGTVVFTGAGVLICMPGMGAIVGSAAITGAAHAPSRAVARERRKRSNGNLAGGLVYYVV